MTHSLPPDRPPSERNPLGFDDFVGIFIAFVSLGAVLLWGLTQNNQGLNSSLLETAPALLPATNPSPLPRSQAPRVSDTVAPSKVPISTLSLQPSQPSALPKVIPFIPTVSVSPQALSFPDVPADFWASPFIAELVRRNILVGFPDGTFRPNQPVTRAEFATMVQKGFERPNNRPSLQFGDLKSGFWANSAIDKAVQMDFMEGYPDNTFRPNQSVPKVQVLTALVNGLNLPQPSAPTDTLRLYQDTNQIPDYAMKPAAAATIAGFVVNYPDRTFLNPQQVTTRADAAALIYQALVWSGKADKVNSAYIVQPKP